MADYTPESSIEKQNALALMLMQRAAQGGSQQYSPIASALQGVVAGALLRKGRKAAEGNQQYRNEFLASMPQGGDLGAYLMQSQDPDLQKAGLGLIGRQPSELDTRLKEAQIKKYEAEAANPLGLTKPPSGYTWGTDGASLEAIPGGPATKIPAETAGRVAMLDTALKDFHKAREVMEGEWGAKGTAQSIIGAGDVGRAQRQVRSLIESALRAMTGAAAPEQEVSRYLDLYMPNSMDGKETAKQKLDLLEGFANNARTIITQGRGQDTAAPPPRPVQTMSVSPDGSMAPTVPQSTMADMGGTQVVTSPTGNARPVPTPDKLQILRQHANNPEARAAFDEIYGAGAADHFLMGGR